MVVGWQWLRWKARSLHELVAVGLAAVRVMLKTAVSEHWEGAISAELE